LPDLLFEIGCEELPAGACADAANQLVPLAGEQLGVRPVEIYVGPRRLAFVLPDLPERTPDTWVQGPPEHLREKAAEGFARKQGVTVDELDVRDGFLGVEVPGKPVREVLPQQLAGIVRGLQFTKTMRWPGTDLRFPRPVRWFCALLDSDPVPVAIDGIPSGNVTYGKRFADGAGIEVTHANAWLDLLRGRGIEPDRAHRYEQIVAGLADLGTWSDPHNVLDEVLYLVESVRVQDGEFDERFLRLPERLIVTTMQQHQRYFPLGGNRFAFVANGGDPEVVREGNVRVLEARLGDAEFTFERDVAAGIDALAERLGSITFLAGAGSFADKTERLVELVRRLGGDEDAVQAARLAKADQAAELVREFAELEGHIGATYANLAGYPDAVVRAIDEQYLPDSSRGPLPSTEAGRILSAADKLDNLATVFGLGKRPTGSSDPYALRRAAIGLWRLALEGGLRIERSLLAGEARRFLEERLEGLLEVPVEFTRAALASRASDLAGVARLARVLHEQSQSDEFAAVYTAYDRAHRLAGKRDDAADALRDDLLEDEAERALAEQVRGLELDPDGDPLQELQRAAAVGPVVERFFDDVLVMAEDDATRANRLRLLLDLRDRLGALGDFSQIPR
jgi:glycyl-tRNA synthetase beta chain